MLFALPFALALSLPQAPDSALMPRLSRALAANALPATPREAASFGNQVLASTATQGPAFTTAPYRHDMIYLGSSVAGGSPHWFLDQLTGRVLEEGNVPQNGGVNGAAYARGGSELYISSGTNNGGSIRRCQVTPLPSTWTTLWVSSGTGPYDVQYSEPQERLYFLGDPGSGSVELQALDIAPGSPTYGAVIAQTFGLVSGDLTERFALSADGRRAVVTTFFTNQLFVVDTDPSSPSFMQPLLTTTIPYDASLAIPPLPTDVALTGDGGMALITLQETGTPSEIARFDLTTGSFIDHNSAQPGVQHIGIQSSPAVALGDAAFTVALSGDDSLAAICGWAGGGWAGALFLDPQTPSTWSYGPFAPGVPLTDSWGLDISSDGTRVAIETQDQLHVLDALTGVLLRTFPISISSGTYTVRMP